jgi:hypothetical protein
VICSPAARSGSPLRILFWLAFWPRYFMSSDVNILILFWMWPFPISLST